MGDEITLAMLALNSVSLSRADDLERAFGELFPSEPNLRAQREGENLDVAVGEHSMLVTLIPAPIPWSSLEGPCSTNRFWPDATDVMRGHVAHALVVGFQCHDGLIERHVAVTRVIATLIACNDSAGVYWGAAPLVAHPGMFCELARAMTRDKLPLYLWIDFRVGRDEEGLVQGFTSGLSAFGYMEVEIVASRREPSEVASVLFNTAHYLLDFGPVLLDGQTIGFSRDEKIQIRHADSVFGHSGKVIRLVV